MRDFRLPYEEARSGFLTFIRSEGLSTDIRWLTADRITSHKRTVWLFRPEEMTSDASSRAHYQKAFTTDHNVRIDADFALAGCTVATVRVLTGESRFLNYGISVNPPECRIVRNRIVWNVLRLWNSLRGHRAYEEGLNIPKAA